MCANLDGPFVEPARVPDCRSIHFSSRHLRQSFGATRPSTMITLVQSRHGFSRQFVRVRTSLAAGEDRNAPATGHLTTNIGIREDPGTIHGKGDTDGAARWYVAVAGYADVFSAGTLPEGGDSTSMDAGLSSGKRCSAASSRGGSRRGVRAVSAKRGRGVRRRIPHTRQGLSLAVEADGAWAASD